MVSSSPELASGFQSVVNALVEKLARSFPYHSMLQLIALENSPPDSTSSNKAVAARGILQRYVGGRARALLASIDAD